MKYDAPIQDMTFLLTEFIGMQQIQGLPGNEEFDADLAEAILEEAGKFASNVLLPLNQVGDQHGAVHENGEVTTPPGFKEAYQQFIENGWTGIDASPEHGGQGLPKVLHVLIDEMFGATNLAFKLYAELSRGAYHLLENTASDEIREKYLPNMVAGTWSGTMCLTEPHAGTDLGLLNTKAVSNGDGTYRISGSKIFITSGDHDLTENILHLVIARLDTAPAGTRGISLFLVPKYLVNDDGSLGERNGVVTASIEHKMGIKGSATCALNFDDATGYLIGEENRGLAAMFKMMNIERMTVAMQGLGLSEIAYQNALVYALDRRQSKAPAPRPDDSKAADPIIYQPEVKRQLLKIRSQVEGARALAAYSVLHVDIMEKADDQTVAADAGHLVALMTPVMKSFFTDLGMESTLSAQQMFGGHGFIAEHGMEQFVRDCRITPLYEGTNEVQALDLVSRKLTGPTGEFTDRFLAEWLDYAQQQGAPDVVAALQRVIEATAWIRERHESDDAAVRGVATQYLRLFALTIIACMWLKMKLAAQDKDGGFYATKKKLAFFYVKQVLPETESLLAKITGGSAALAGFEVTDFGE